MFFKKIVAVLFICSVFIFYTHAYDTQGKFGMGVRMWGTPLLLFSSMKIGVVNALGLEPSAGFSQVKMVIEDSVEVYDPIIGDYVLKENKETIKYNVFMISNIFDIKPVRKEKSNFLVRAGFGYFHAKSSDENEEVSLDDYETTVWSIRILGGLGIEHFFTDYFSAYAGFLGGWALFNSDDDTYDYFSAMHIGNQFAELSFVFYLK